MIRYDKPKLTVAARDFHRNHLPLFASSDAVLRLSWLPDADVLQSWLPRHRMMWLQPEPQTTNHVYGRKHQDNIKDDVV